MFNTIIIHVQCGMLVNLEKCIFFSRLQNRQLLYISGNKSFGSLFFHVQNRNTR